MVVTDLTLLEDRLLVHRDEGATELPLAYQIHSRLVQTGELARLLAEHLRDEGGSLLPAPGSRVRLLLPLGWGLVCLRLPYAGLGQLGQPLHQVAWELDCNAPEQSEQYLFDYQEHAGPGPAGGETRVMAVRTSLVQFCRTLADELGWALEELAPASEMEAPFHLDVKRALRHQEALAGERYTPVARWGRVLTGAAALGLICAASLLWITRTHAPVTPVTPSPVPADSLRAHLPASPPLPAPLTNAPGRAWTALLRELAAREAALPDFLVLDAQGVLVRGRSQENRRVLEQLPRPAGLRRAGEATAWLVFADSLAGGLVPEDPTLPVRRFTLASLAELPAHLDGDPARLILQRRRGAPGGADWFFPVTAVRGEPRGWQVTLFPGRKAGAAGN